MKYFILLFILLLSGCSVSPQIKPTAPVLIESGIILNEALLDSSLLENNIYNPEEDVVQVDSANGSKFEIPDDYEIALETKYSVKDYESLYNIITLRQANKAMGEDITDISLRMPEKPLIVVITDDKNVIVTTFIISSYSALRGSMGWDDYDKSKITAAVELKDLNGDGIFEILIHTFKGYTADAATGMIIIYFEPVNSMFTVADKLFWSTWKEAFKIIEINNNTYVLEASPGSGNCRICPTPYLVRIYSFTGNYFFDIGSVGVEKEFDEGDEAIEYVLPKVREKVLTGDIFIL